MKTFTQNPLERFMMQVPRAQREERRPIPAPRGHFCYGCGRFGMTCIRPCYRDKTTQMKEDNHEKISDR